MHIKAEKLFTQVLKDEMKKKGEELDLFYSFSGISSDTIPLTISIMTETGSRQYKVDAGEEPEKSFSDIERTFITLCYLFWEAVISHDFESDLGG